MDTSRTHGRRAALRVVALAAAAILLLAAFAMPGSLLLGKTSPTADGSPAPTADWTPGYARDVAPIFARACVRCHGSERADKGLRLDSYQRVMAGDSYGTVVIPGDSSLSAIVRVVKYGTMPHGGTRITEREIEIISRWIDAGARNE